MIRSSILSGRVWFVRRANGQEKVVDHHLIIAVDFARATQRVLEQDSVLQGSANSQSVPCGGCKAEEAVTLTPTLELLRVTGENDGMSIRNQAPREQLDL